MAWRKRAKRLTFRFEDSMRKPYELLNPPKPEDGISGNRGKRASVGHFVQLRWDEGLGSPKPVSVPIYLTRPPHRLRFFTLLVHQNSGDTKAQKVATVPGLTEAAIRRPAAPRRVAPATAATHAGRARCRPRRIVPEIVKRYDAANPVAEGSTTAKPAVRSVAGSAVTKPK